MGALKDALLAQAAALRAQADALEALANSCGQGRDIAPPSGDEWVALRATGISARTLRRAIAAGELDAARVGREYRVRRNALEQWLSQHRVRPRPKAPRQKSAAERAIERAMSAGTLRVVPGRGERDAK